jgi:hypothetical protein
LQGERAMKKTVRGAFGYAVFILILIAAIGSTSLFLSFNKRLVGGKQIEALIVEWDQVMTGSIKK